MVRPCREGGFPGSCSIPQSRLRIVHPCPTRLAARLHAGCADAERGVTPAQRTGANSILPIHKRAPTLTLAADDILYIDLGPIFDQTIEADFARTYVIGARTPQSCDMEPCLELAVPQECRGFHLRQLWSDASARATTGDDPKKLQLAAALPKIFAACKRHYLANPDQTGAEFYAFVCKCAPGHRPHEEHARRRSTWHSRGTLPCVLACRHICMDAGLTISVTRVCPAGHPGAARRTCEEHGYQYGNHYCAHLLDEFSHKTKHGMEAANFASPDCRTPMSAPGADGQPRFWVLEVHVLQDPAVGTCAPAQIRDPGSLGLYPSALMLITWPYSLGAEWPAALVGAGGACVAGPRRRHVRAHPNGECRVVRLMPCCLAVDRLASQHAGSCRALQLQCRAACRACPALP